MSIVFSDLLGLLPPLLLRTLIDNAVPEQNRRMILWLGTLTIFAACCIELAELVATSSAAIVGEGLVYNLRLELFEKIQRMPLEFFVKTPSGTITTWLNDDVIRAQRAVTGRFGQLISNVVVLATSFGAMLLLDRRLGGVGVLGLVLFVIPSRWIGTRLVGFLRERMEVKSAVTTQMAEQFNVAGARLVKLDGRPDIELKRFSTSASRLRDLGVTTSMYDGVFAAGISFAEALGTGAVIVFGAYLTIDKQVSAGTLIAVAALLIRIYGPAIELTSLYSEFLAASVSFHRIFKMLDAEEGIVIATDAVELPLAKGHVEFTNVSFSYNKEASPTASSREPVEGAIPVSIAQMHDLRDISLVVEPGQMVAIVGPSGAGKSTIAALLARLYDVSAGAIRIDGHDIRLITPGSLAASVGVVSQPAHLFNESVAQNLRLARPDASDSDLEIACRRAQVHDVVVNLPDGYDTIVGESGARLSGGEVQRLAVARLLLKDPPIVVLDEATSQIDARNEHLIQLALESALKGRTSIVVAHRLATVRSANNIIVLDGGRIVERGTHGELLALGGMYSRMQRYVTE
jgi:ATP-binding cassette, subfamily B, bacterial